MLDEIQTNSKRKKKRKRRKEIQYIFQLNERNEWYS